MKVSSVSDKSRPGCAEPVLPPGQIQRLDTLVFKSQCEHSREAPEQRELAGWRFQRGGRGGLRLVLWWSFGALGWLIWAWRRRSSLWRWKGGMGLWAQWRAEPLLTSLSLRWIACVGRASWVSALSCCWSVSGGCLIPVLGAASGNGPYERGVKQGPPGCRGWVQPFCHPDLISWLPCKLSSFISCSLSFQGSSVIVLIKKKIFWQVCFLFALVWRYEPSSSVNVLLCILRFSRFPQDLGLCWAPFIFWPCNCVGVWPFW